MKRDQAILFHAELWAWAGRAFASLLSVETAANAVLAVASDDRADAIVRASREGAEVLRETDERRDPAALYGEIATWIRRTLRDFRARLSMDPKHPKAPPLSLFDAYAGRHHRALLVPVMRDDAARRSALAALTPARALHVQRTLREVHVECARWIGAWGDDVDPGAHAPVGALAAAAAIERGSIIDVESTIRAIVAAPDVNDLRRQRREGAARAADAALAIAMGVSAQTVKNTRLGVRFARRG